MSDGPSTLRELVGAYLAEQCRTITEAEPDLRSGVNVIHPTRVAVRRLRSTLRVYADLFDVPRAGHLEEELVWWAGLLGEVRDLDVLGERLTDLIADLPPEAVIGPVQATIDAEIAVRRTRAMAIVTETLDSDRYRRLAVLADRWRIDAPFTELADRPVGAARAYVKTADKKVRKRLATAITAHRLGDPAVELFHRARKAGKRHRYAAEAAQLAAGGKSDQVIEQRKALQDVLGDHHDSFASAAFLRDLGVRYGRRSGQNGFTFGLLYAHELGADDRLLAELKPFL